MQYVSNKKLHSELLAYKQKYDQCLAEGKKPPRYSEYIGLCIYQMSNRYASKAKFSSYSFKEEMISDGIEDCIKYLHNFNAVKFNNPFAYITQIIHNAFIRRILKEQKNQYVKMISRQNYQLESQLVDNSFTVDEDDVASTYIKNFEQKQSDKKKKISNKKKGLNKFIDNETS